jgi:hypothetical protein
VRIANVHAGRAITFVGGLLLLGVIGGCAQAVPPVSAKVVRRFRAREANQAVAVDDKFFYAIGDAVIGKYEKATGQRVGGWQGDTGGPILHLNSGVVVGPELYCAHSNYPLTPMVSSIEVFDTERMAHLRSLPLPSGLGSATWVDHDDGSWWVTFAHYSGKGGEPGKGSDATRLERFTETWHREEEWSFPAAVVSRWETMSSSGGTLAAPRVFYTTGHHAPELYVLEVPAAGRELVLRAIILTESEGQGIALDRHEGTLYSIQRRTGEVIESALPAGVASGRR